MVVQRFVTALRSAIRAAAAADNPLSAIQSAAAAAALSTATTALIGAVALIGVVAGLLWLSMSWCFTSTGAAILAVWKRIQVVSPSACGWLAAAVVSCQKLRQ